MLTLLHIRVQLIEASTGHKACVVYGALPPEMRRLQARLFNDPASEYKVCCVREALCRCWLQPVHVPVMRAACQQVVHPSWTQGLTRC